MKITPLRSFVLSLLLVSAAHAVPIQLNPGNTPEPFSSGDSFVETWMSNLVTAYNTANSTSLPAPGSQIFRVNTSQSAPTGFPVFGNGTTSITIPTGSYDYIAVHWGGPSNNYQAFYIGDYGAATEFVFNAPGRQGLSWYSLFSPSNPPSNPTPVPDSGSSLALLTGAAIACVVARRWMRGSR